MSEPQSHEMQLAAQRPTGEEEWFCPICGRRILMHWPPAYKKVVIAPGDEHAYHSGGKGGLQIGWTLSREAASPALSEERRTQLEEILKGVDLGD